MMPAFQAGRPRCRGGLRLSLLTLLTVAASLASAPRAEAQDSLFMPFIGATTGGDTRTTSTVWGFSTAYLEENGWGGEFDFSHTTDFNDIDFESTGITTAMLNLMVRPKVHRWFWPYGVAGLGLIRARGCGGPNCVTEFSRTDLGLDAGGGAFVPFNDIFAVRGDLRYFRYATINQDLPRTHSGPFDFWRITAAGTVTW
jgi:hypothetical protein